jgi:hypothetical protein
MKIEVQRLWAYAPGKRLHPGTYRVPEDVDQITADRAVADGAAVRLPEPEARPNRKGPAPENKVLDHAPDTKSA